MKKIYYILLVFTLGLASCDDWLDITPTDTVVEEQLFSTGDGYRNVLNGVYKQIAQNSMYGRSLSYGMLDAMGQLYNARGFHSSSIYAMAMSYSYEDQEMESAIESIWSTTYNAIANCNSILAKIDDTDSTLFRSLNNEKMLIKGEALALRAFLHFDMMRLFAPNPRNGDEQTYIPYFKVYPSTFEPNRTTKEVLDFVILDLDEAFSLVVPQDTIAWRIMLTTNARFTYTQSYSSYNPDLFFRHRGYRMNYLAICSMLARVYNYYGVFDNDYYQKAYDIAEHVMEFKEEIDGYYSCIDFTDYYYIEDDPKAVDEVIFCLSNQKLREDYATLRSSGVEFYLRSDLFDDAGDVRQSYLTTPRASYRVCIKNEEVSTGSTYANEDMIPLLRLGELYFIQAEVLARRGEIAAAVDKIDEVRYVRDCQIGPTGTMAKEIQDWESFKKVMVMEATREFMQEGQAFFYYKRFNILPSASATEADFVLPKPDSEVLY